MPVACRKREDRRKRRTNTGRPTDRERDTREHRCDHAAAAPRHLQLVLGEQHPRERQPGIHDPGKGDENAGADLERPPVLEQRAPESSNTCAERDEHRGKSSDEQRGRSDDPSRLSASSLKPTPDTDDR